jgi:hypothetical protein
LLFDGNKDFYQQQSHPSCPYEPFMRIISAVIYLRICYILHYT